MVQDKGPDQINRDMPPDDPINHNEDDDVNDEEYNALNNQLDQLNGWLDNLEEKNASIHEQLLDLLKKSKTTREEFQKMMDQGESSSQPPTNDGQPKNSA